MSVKKNKRQTNKVKQKNRISNKNTKGKAKNSSKLKKLMAFVVFQLFFCAVTMPLFVFYGPFENIKSTMVGASWNTLRHQYIAKLFLSDDAIYRILHGAFAVDPTAMGEQINILEFDNVHTDAIEIYNVNGTDFRGKLLVIDDPTSIKTGFSEQMPRAGETVSVIAGRSKALAAINAGGFVDSGWTGTGGNPMGFIIHNGEFVFNPFNNEDAKFETVAFTDKGMLIVGRHSIRQLKSYGVKEGVSFGPPLIVNGKPTIKKGDGGWGIAPRTAIGQRENGQVLMLVIDGRSLQSLGATLRDVQDILLEYGAVNAANLDGGSSTTMYFNGKVINKPSDKLGERTVPSVFMVVPESGGAGK